jgi:hypothetical protein
MFKLQRLGLSLILLFSLLVTLLFSGWQFSIVEKVKANPDWLSGWSYRKSHVINNATGAGSNYQVEIKACYNDSNIDICEYKEQISGTDLDAEQGVCTDGNNLFVTSTTRLRKYGMSGGSKLADVDVFNGDTDVNHSGGCCYYDDKIYVVCSNYPTSTIRRTYVYNASDLSYVTNYTISDNPSSGTHTSGIGYDATNGCFWICTYRSLGDDYVYKYNTSMVYQNENHALGHHYCQDVTENEGKFYTVEGTGKKVREFNSSWSELRSQNNVGGEGLDIHDGLLYIGWDHTGGTDPLKAYYFPPASEVTSLEEHCRTDFGDVRFTDDDGSTELDFWMEELNSGHNATFWVQVKDDLSSANRTIYMYYGNTTTSGGVTTSNMTGTAVEVDDFEYSDSIENHGWTITLGEAATTTDEQKYGSRSLAITRTATEAGQGNKALGQSSYRAFMWLYDTEGAGDSEKRNYAMCYDSDPVADAILIGYKGAQSADYYAWWDGSWHTTSVARSIGWHKIEWYFYGNEVYGKIDETSIFTGNSQCGKASGIKYEVSPSPSPTTEYQDSWIVFKYVNPEPSHGSWGNEELGNSISQNSPSNGATETQWLVNFNYTVTYYDTPKNACLRIFNSTDNSLVSTVWNNTALVNATSVDYGNYTFSVEQDYKWDCIYYNNSGNSWQSTSNWTLTVDLPTFEITVNTATHSWTITPGESDILINEGSINSTVTATVNFDVQVKGSGDLANGTNTIPLSNVKVNYTGTPISLSTEYQTVPGLSDQESGTDIEVTFQLWLSCPTPLPVGAYTYTLYIRVIEHA